MYAVGGVGDTGVGFVVDGVRSARGEACRLARVRGGVCGGAREVDSEGEREEGRGVRWGGRGDSSGRLDVGGDTDRGDGGPAHHERVRVLMGGARETALLEAPLRGDLCVTRAWLPGRPSPRPSPRGDLCVTRSWLRGRPLTEFGRGRPILPLPLERVKTGVPLKRLTPNTVAFPKVRVRVAADSRGRGVVQRSPEGEGERAARF